MPPARAELRLYESLAKGTSHTHDLAGGFHLRAKNSVYTGEFDEREHRFLDTEIRRLDFLGDTLAVQ